MFFFNDPATTEIYTLSLHDALPILRHARRRAARPRALLERSADARAAPAAPRRVHRRARRPPGLRAFARRRDRARSEEHTSELQSQSNLVCRLLLEKKKLQIKTPMP